MEPKVIKIEIKVTRTIVTVLAGLLLVALALLAVSSAGAHPPLEGPGGQGEVTVASTVPPMISYQGQLLDSSGNPVPNGTYTMTFKLYNVASGGMAFWTETHSSVQVTDGLFNVLLGEYVSLRFIDPDGEIYPIDPLYLGVTVGGDSEMTPRQRMVSVPFAFRAEIADTDNDWDGAGTGKMHTHYLTDTVGIGTADPQGLLQVGGGTFIVTTRNDVGIGTINPQTELHVVDTRKSTDPNDIDFWPNGILVESNSATSVPNHSPRLGLVDTNPNLSITTAPAWYIGNWADRFQIFRQPNIQSIGEDFLNIVNTGNVGIGTREPSERLDVDGGVRVRDLPDGSDLDDIVVADSNGVLHTRDASTLGGADADWYDVATGSPPTSILDDIYTLGKVGIGTTNPQGQLDVACPTDPKSNIRLYPDMHGGCNSVGIVMNEYRGNNTLLMSAYDTLFGNFIYSSRDTAFTTGQGFGIAGGSWMASFPRFVVNADDTFLGYSIYPGDGGSTGGGDGTGNLYVRGKVGIGTTTPQNKLDVAGGVAVGVESYTGPAPAPTDGMAIYGDVAIGHYPEGGRVVPYEALRVLQADPSTPIFGAYNQAGNLMFQIAGGVNPHAGLVKVGGVNTAVDLLVGDSTISGKIGVGTSSPQSTLQVEGDPGYLQIDSINVVPPPAVGCSDPAHIGRMILTYDSTNSYLCVCKPKPSLGWSCVSLP